MENKYKVADILLTEFNSIYCSSCKNINSSECEECHRKYLSWSLSSETAIEIAEKIIDKLEN